MPATIELDGQTLIIKLPLQTPIRSASGKTLVVATTHGTITTEARYEKKRIVVVANAFVYPKEKGGEETRADWQKVAGNSK
jgi:hypothetical protein